MAIDAITPSASGYPYGSSSSGIFQAEFGSKFMPHVVCHRVLELVGIGRKSREELKSQGKTIT